MIEALISAAYISLKLPEDVEPKEYYGKYEMIVTGGEYFCMMDQEDVDLLARVVMSEAGGESMECKEAVATVVLNRLASPDYPMTIHDVVYQKNAFSTHNNGAPTQDCYTAVFSALVWFGSDNEILPRSIYYFRAGHYHKWALDYKKIGALYFSAPKTASID